MCTLNKSSFLFFLFAWSAAATAQAQMVPVWTDELNLYGWKTWAFILLYSVIGSGLRLAVDYRKGGLSLERFDLAALLFISMVSGLIGFVLVEWAVQRWGMSPPPGVVGGLVLLAAFNNKRTIDLASAGLAHIVSAWARRIAKNQPEDAPK